LVLYTCKQEEEIERLKSKAETLALDLEDATAEVSNLQSERNKLANVSE
jgi:cell division protein FtsB